MLFQHTMMISFGILIGMSLEGVMYLNDIDFRWYHPLSVVVTSVLCSIPSLILCSERELPRNKFRIRIAIHFLLLFTMVLGLGWLFNWYSKLEGALYIVGIFTFVYLFVWVASSWMGASDQKHINNALESIRDEE